MNRSQSFTLYDDGIIRVNLPSGYKKTDGWHFFEWDHLIGNENVPEHYSIDLNLTRSMFKFFKRIIMKTKMFDDEVVSRRLLRRGKTNIKTKAIESLVEAHDRHIDLIYTRWDVLFKFEKSDVHMEFFGPGDADANCPRWENVINSFELLDPA